MLTHRMETSIKKKMQMGPRDYSKLRKRESSWKILSTARRTLIVKKTSKLEVQRISK